MDGIDIITKASIIELIADVMMCFGKIKGKQDFPLTEEFLDRLPYWNDKLEEKFKKQLVDNFKLDIDFKKLKPLTFYNIANYIMQKKTADFIESYKKGDSVLNRIQYFQIF